jgi:uncharacterized protein YwqG
VPNGNQQIAEKDLSESLATSHPVREVSIPYEMQDRESIRRQLIDLGLYRIADKVVSLARPCMRMETLPTADAAIPAAATKFGGMPDLPPTFHWPRWNAQPLAFLGQIDLASLSARACCASLPATGVLSFFYDSQQSTWGFDPEDVDSWHVYHFEDTTLQRHAMPATLPYEARSCPCKLAFEEVLSFPSWESLFIQHLRLSDDERDRYMDFEDANEVYARPAHQILGHPQEIQGEMQLECQLASNGFYCGTHDVYEDPRASQLEHSACEWTLLLQCDSDDNVGWMWGDLGRLYFWIKQVDLRRRRFDNVWMILQCT